jgi:flagellar protein FlaJ
MEKVSGILSAIARAILTRKTLFLILLTADTVITYIFSVILPFPLGALLGASVTISTVVLLVYYNITKRVGVIPVSHDLLFVLVHLRCMITGNPPLGAMFKRVADTPTYSKKYREIFGKLYNLTRNWGYSVPEALRLVAKITTSKVDEQFLQRFAAIVATGSDVKEYLRLEYNTLSAEYTSSYNRFIGTLSVVLGVYTTLLGALAFLIAVILLMGMLFGGLSQSFISGVLGVGLSLSGMSLLLFILVKRPLFEYKRGRSMLVKVIRVLGASGVVFMAFMILYMLVTGALYSLRETGLMLVVTGIVLLPAGILVKMHEGAISELDLFYPAFIRSYGEHLAVIPDMVSSLKPLLAAELGRLRKALSKVYAGLVNRVDPRIMWVRFAEETCSELIYRSTSIFMDTLELGGDMGETGALLSEHFNNLYRIRASYTQVFKTFETTLYVMHLVVVLLLVFISGFVKVFSYVLTNFVGGVPAVFADIFAFFTITPEDVSFVVNLLTLVILISNSVTLYSVNPGSRYELYYFLAVLFILTGIGVYAGDITVDYLFNTVFSSL